MKSRLRLSLQTNPTQHARLAALQQAFAAVCNTLAPIAQEHACWNRVALHHMAYKAMRQRFPDLGSQMICNAIYSVSRACRLVYQHPQSPFNLQRLAGKALPRVQFLPQSPVYFDRHTLSLKDGQVSMFTLDGRMRFRMALGAEDEQRFRQEKLREIVLTQEAGHFVLTFHFVEPGELAEEADASAEAGEFPEYMLVLDEPGTPTAPAARTAPIPNHSAQTP